MFAVMFDYAVSRLGSTFTIQSLGLLDRSESMQETPNNVLT